MTVTNWINQTGNWTTTADWSAGEPNSTLDAYLGFGGTYTLILSTAAQAHSLVMAGGAGSTFSETATGSLAAKGGLVVHSGTAILDGANALGLATLDGGTIVAGNANALGFTDLTMDAGLLTNNVSLALANNLDISGTPTIAAAHGTTFTVGGGDGWYMDLTKAVTLTIGASGADGTVVWRTGVSSMVALGQPLHVVVGAGVLKAGDHNFTLLVGPQNDGDTTVAAGATIDLAGFSAAIGSLQGAGRVTSATAATLTLYGGTTFAGQITGPLSLEVLVATLAGANTYTGQTTIDSGGELVLGAGGTTGSIAATSPINDMAVAHLLIDHSNAVTIANPISGGGDVRQIGTGATILSHANTYAGGTVVDSGTLETTNASGLGTGPLYMDGGGARFLAGVNFVLPSTLDIYWPTTLAAATGDTLTTNATKPWGLHLSGYLTFGAGSAFAGAVQWNTPAGYNFSGAGAFAINIAYGTLKAGDNSFYFLTDHDVNHVVSGTTIGSSGTLDAAGHPMAITNLRGSGVIANSGSATTLNFAGGSFSGKINGALTPYMSGVVSLTGGLGNFTAPLTIYSGSTLTLAGASAHNYVLADNSGSATMLILAAGASETGVLHGFIANDTLDLRGVAFATASKAFAFNASATTGGKLTVTDGTHTEVVTLAGNYTGATFTLASDGHGGTDVTVVGAVAAAVKGPSPASPQRFAAAMAGFAVGAGLPTAVAETWRGAFAALAAPRAHSA
jgi:autotransporter-associated beta strand protein